MKTRLPGSTRNAETRLRIGRKTQEHIAGVNNDFYATILTMASHDLRQPLQVIIGAHDILAERLDKLDRTVLARAERATARLASMLDDLVDALRYGNGSAIGARQPVSLDPILAALAAECRQPAERNGVRIRVVRTSATALSHPVLLSGILRNLIRNAVAYTPQGGRVLVGCRRRGPELRISIRDTGIGIPAEDLPFVFNAFRRADASESNHLGLGLFIVKSAADLLGHRVEVQSAVGRGSCFTIVAEAVSAAPSAQSAAFCPRDYPASAGSHAPSHEYSE
jgi:two-component system phosphate regulon sensor histidine kinase PhoR